MFVLLLRRPTNGVTDMVLPSTPNKTALFTACEEQWGAGVVPRPEWEENAKERIQEANDADHGRHSIATTGAGAQGGRVDS